METVQNAQLNLNDLDTAVQNAVKQIRACDEQIALWQAKRNSLQKEVNDKLSRLLLEVSEKTATVEKPVEKPTKQPTLSELIHSFLEKNGPARAKDIRKFLLQQGRTTNPGVALSRMVKNGGISNMERGLYKVC